MFDEKKLLQRIGKEHRTRAQHLLHKLQERPNELSFDSSGTIYIDEESIPNSNIFKWLPLLFKKRTPKGINGFENFRLKLEQMGLGHLVQYPIDHKKASKIDDAIGGSFSSKNNSNWWYLG